MSKAKPLHYLSYAGEEGFRGAVMIRAADFLAACFIAARSGLSPGGEVFGAEIPDEMIPAPEWHNRLLSKAELETIWPGQCLSIGEMVAEAIRAEEGE